MAEKEKEIKEAIETLEDISSDKAKERIAELRQKYIMDKKSELRTAREIGIKEGKEESIKAIVNRMREKNIPLNDIIELTGIKKEELEQIIKEV